MALDYSTDPDRETGLSLHGGAPLGEHRPSVAPPAKKEQAGQEALATGSGWDTGSSPVACSGVNHWTPWRSG
jgi:hypothetical protein